MMRASRAISAGKWRQLDPAEVGQRDFAAPTRFATTLIDLRLNRPHLLVRDHEEIARAAGRIEDPDFRDALPQVEQHAGIVPRFLKPRPQIVEKQRIEYLQNVRHARVVHAERAAFFILRDGLDHRAKNVRVDLRPVEIADMKKIGARDPAETRHVQAAGEEPPVHIREHIRPPRHVGGGPFDDFRVHGAEERADHLVSVRRVPRAHLFDRGREQASAVEDVGVLGKEAED